MRAQGHDYLACDVILSAAAIHSPTLLFKSSITDADGFETLGSQRRQGLKGAGQHLRDHTATYIVAPITHSAT